MVNRMKKLSIILLIALVFTMFTACESKELDSSKETGINQTTEETTSDKDVVKIGINKDSLAEPEVFIDNMENYRADALLSEVISSEQIQELYNEGSIKGISPEEIDQMLAFEYSFSGKEDNDLYQRILVEIDSYDAGSDMFRYN